MCLDPYEEISPRDQFKWFEKDFESEECDEFIKEYNVNTRYKKVFDTNKLQLYADNGYLKKLLDHDTFERESLDY